MTPLAILIPAHDEAEWITACLDAVLASEGVRGSVIVAANGCRDETVALARAQGARAAERGWALTVLDLPTPGKPAALAAAEAAAPAGACCVYLDADVTVSPHLLAAIAAALAVAQPRYVTGRAQVTARGWVARAYARLWTALPFVAGNAPGFGLFALNAAGRARWREWPDIISDDTFARLQFAPDERVQLPQPYDWPLTEGFLPLVRVRRRQNEGVRQLRALFPALFANDTNPRPGPGWLLGRALRDPVAFCIYAAVVVAVRLRGRAGAGQPRWARGR